MRSSSSIANLRGVLVANGRRVQERCDGAIHRAAPTEVGRALLFVSTGASVAYRPGGLAYDGIRCGQRTSADGTITRLGVMDSVPRIREPFLLASFAPTDIVYDGRNLWVSEAGAATAFAKARPMALRSIRFRWEPARRR